MTLKEISEFRKCIKCNGSSRLDEMAYDTCKQCREQEAKFKQYKREFYKSNTNPENLEADALLQIAWEIKNK